VAKSGSKGDGKRRADEKLKKRDADEAKKAAGDKKASGDKKAAAGTKKDKQPATVTLAERAVEKASVGATARSNGATKLKSVKLKRAEGTQQLVEQVAAEIVIAELDRANNPEQAAADFPALTPQSIETVKAAAEGHKKSARKGGAKSGGKGKNAATVAPEAVAADTVAADADTVAADAAAPEVAPETAAKGKAARGKSAQKSVKQEADAAPIPFSELLRVPAGSVDLAAIDPASTPGVSSRDQAEEELPKLAVRLEELQERLFAAARGGDSNRRVLLVLQGMDTSGKGGTVRHVVGQLDPNGTRLTAFKAPTEEERAHDFLWRIRSQLPVAGEVGIFDRSHYEDVLIARVRKLALPMIIGRRYQLINGFEQKLVADGVVLVKCFLHISREEQKQRLLARLDDPAKHWKYNPGDVDERALWPQYQDAYRIALEKCSTPDAPWYAIPADHKWYRNYAVTRLLVEALERIDPEYPAGKFDVEVERKRVLAS